MSDHIAPNTDNYYIGKGTCFFTPEGGTRRHLGNCAAASFEANLEDLEHFSSMEGIRSKDKVVVVTRGGTVSVTMEEWTRLNVAMAVLGEIDANPDSDGNVVINILQTDYVNGRLEIIGTNDVGPKYTWDLPKVAMRPSAALDLITDEWGQIEIAGEVLVVGGSSGTITLQDSATT